MAPRKDRPSRGRGRGRGRGNADVATGGSREDSQAQDEQSAATGPPTSTTPTFSTSSAVQLQQQQELSQFPSPNTSPAPAPTETPAPTPVRPPLQRLDSLGLSERGAHSAGRGMGGRVMAGKIKPKAVTRRSVAERVQAQREEDERRRGREIEAQREQNITRKPYGGTHGNAQTGSRNWDRGTMRGRGRGRGEAMGRGGLDRNTKTQREASGLFGVAPAAAGKKPAGIPPATSITKEIATSNSMDNDAQSMKSGSNASLSHLNTKSTKSNTSTQFTKVKQDPDTLPRSGIGGHAEVDYDTQSNKVKIEIPDPIYPEEQEEGSRPAPRVDIEQINLVTDDENDDSDEVVSGRNKGKGKKLPNTGGLKPVRLQREQHKERVTMVNTDSAATTLTDDSKELGAYQAFVSADGGGGGDDDEDQIEYSRDRRKWSGAWQDDESEVKFDPGASDDAMDVDIVEDPTTLHKGSEVAAGQLSGEKEPATLASNEKGKMQHRTKPKKGGPVLQTEEDRAEYARYLEDLRILAQELGGVQNLLVEKNAGTIDLDGETITEQPRVKDHEGRLYLFQFPPVLPSLINKIKKEEATDGGPEPMEVEAGPSNAAESIDLTKPDPEEAVHIETPYGVFHAPPELITEEGFVGKLIVRRSGKVQLDWGGTILELGRGVESDYLTTTMIVEGLGERGQSDASARPMGTGTGTGTGMGKVMGKFVLTPNFEVMGEM